MFFTFKPMNIKNRAGYNIFIFSYYLYKEKIGLKLRTSGGSNQTNPAEIIKRS